MSSVDPIQLRLDRIEHLRSIAARVTGDDRALLLSIADEMDRDTACRGCTYGGPHDHRCRYGLDRLDREKAATDA